MIEPCLKPGIDIVASEVVQGPLAICVADVHFGQMEACAQASSASGDRRGACVVVLVIRLIGLFNFWLRLQPRRMDC